MIIYLDANDEINTIVRRVQATTESEIVLVVPPESKALRDRINLQLLHEYATKAGKVISLQTGDLALAKLAQELEIPVVVDETASTSEGEPSDVDDYGSSGRRTKRNPWRERLFVILLIAASVLALLYYHLPKAVIVVTPQVFEFVENLEFQLTDLDGVTPVKANTLIMHQTPATGRETVGIATATGVVTLVNQSQNAVTVTKGTVVKTGSGISFETTQNVVIPAVQTQYFMDIPTGLTAGRAEVAISALQPGSHSNVAAGRIVVIEMQNIDVRNLDPTTGGEDVVLQVATEADVTRSKDLVLRDAKSSALAAVQKELGIGQMLTDTLTFEVEWEDVTAVGSQTEQVSVTGLCRAQVYSFDPELLSDQITASMKALVPNGYQMILESFSFSDLDLEQKENDWHIRIIATGYMTGIIEPEQLATLLAGKEQSQFAEVLATFPTIAQIDVTAGASDKLPRLPRWLKVEIAEPVF